MADPSACWDWYFRPAWNDFNFGNKKEIAWSKVWGICGDGGGGVGGGGEAKQLLLLSLKTP